MVPTRRILLLELNKKESSPIVLTTMKKLPGNFINRARVPKWPAFLPLGTLQIENLRPAYIYCPGRSFINVSRIIIYGTRS